MNMPGNKMTKILSLKRMLSLALLFVLLLACAEAQSRPNIVVILVDDMGWSDIASYGGEIPTPNLDALAKNGVRFTQFYNTARCSPSRASLLTGHYPHQAGMGYLDNLIRQDSLGYQGKLSDRSVTIAEVLKASGYFTAMSGKWHLGQQNGTPPWKRGFDRSLNIRAGGIFFPNQSGNPNDPLSERAKEPLYLNGAALSQTAPEFGQDWYATYLWTDFGLKFIDEALKEKKPFFLYLAHNAPHFPLMAPKELIAKYKGKYMAGWDKLREERYRRQLKMGLVDPKWPLSPRAADTPAWDSLSPAEKERYDQMMAVYAAMIEAIDRSVGSLVKGLRDRGALDNTLILFLSDNGGNGEAGPKGRSEGAELGSKDSTVYIGMNWAALNNTPFRRFKHFTHEGGVATPLIAHWPAGIPKARNGKLEHQPGHLIDIMATVVEITGAKYLSEFNGQAIYPMEGVSLRPAFNGRPLKRAEPIFFEHEGNRAIRYGKWKLVSKYMDGWELYDLEADRTELNDLAEKKPEIVKDLSARWEAWAKRTHTDQWLGPRRNDWGEVPRPENQATAKPNILILYADDWRHDTLGVAGNPVVKTPNLDRLAREGFRFTNARVTTSICGVSRASLFTGQWMSRHGNTAFDAFRTPWAETYPGLLRANGYYVGHIGKWHNGKFPVEQFDFGRAYSGTHFIKQADGSTIHVTRKNENDALEFLRSAPRDKPFCLTLAFFATHAEDQNPKQYLYQPESESLYQNVTIPAPKTATEEHFKRLPEFIANEKNEGRNRWHWRFDTPEKYQQYMKAYYRMATEVDATVGRMLAELQARGLMENTLVIFTTDNGYFHGEHGLADKWYPYEESVRVPLVVRDPRMPESKRGKTNDDFVLNVDLAPTILAFAGVAAPAGMQGRDFAPLYLAAKRAAWRQEFFYEHAVIRNTDFIPSSEALVRKDVKYIYWPDFKREELFDLKRDPFEERNLAQDAARAKTLAALRKRFVELKAQAK